MTADSRNGATPGPWVGFVDRSSGEVVFAVHPSGRHGEIASGIRNRADLTLIIAAPDMLALLKRIAEAQHVWSMEEVIEVVAKAEGRA